MGEMMEPNQSSLKEQANHHNKSTKWMLFLIPLVTFSVLVIFLLKGLFSDPRVRESVTVDRHLPQFLRYDLMDSTKEWRHTDLIGEVLVINVWGTWCVTCDQELPYLTELRRQGVKIVGIYYDQEIDPDFDDSFDLVKLRQQVRDKLARLGDPYQYNIFDHTRELLLDLGVTGAPETFLIDHLGVIKEHHLGDINPRVWQTKFAGLYQDLQTIAQQSMTQQPITQQPITNQSIAKE